MSSLQELNTSKYNILFYTKKIFLLNQIKPCMRFYKKLTFKHFDETFKQDKI
jgi:hypothetical protein